MTVNLTKPEQATPTPTERAWTRATLRAYLRHAGVPECCLPPLRGAVPAYTGNTLPMFLRKQALTIV